MAEEGGARKQKPLTFAGKSPFNLSGTMIWRVSNSVFMISKFTYKVYCNIRFDSTFPSLGLKIGAHLIW